MKFLLIRFEMEKNQVVVDIALTNEWLALATLLAALLTLTVNVRVSTDEGREATTILNNIIQEAERDITNNIIDLRSPLPPSIRIRIAELRDTIIELANGLENLRNNEGALSYLNILNAINLETLQMWMSTVEPSFNYFVPILSNFV
jgi:hypothetical protein